MAQIDVQTTRDDTHGYQFTVTVEETGDTSVHHVTLSRQDLERWGSSFSSPEEFITRCFEFLLERERKESILSRFDVSQIGSYFPEFEQQIRKLAG
jgi:hypothetical protein